MLYRYRSIWTGFLLSMALFSQAYAIPPNNNLGEAIEIDSMPYSNSQNTEGAEQAVFEVSPQCVTTAGASVWYQYNSQQDDTLVFDTFGSDYDTVLSIWTGTPGSLTQIACQDDSGDDFQSQIGLPVNQDTTYYINISGMEGKTGQLVFNAKTLAPLENDNLADAIDVGTTIPYSYSQSTVGASNESQAAEPSCATVGADVWFQYTADTDRMVVFDTFGSDYNTVLSAWSGTSHPLTEEACNDDGNEETEQSEMSLAVTADTQYAIKVSGWRPSSEIFGKSGLLVFNVNLPAENDDLSEAVIINELPYTSTSSSAGATNEADEVIPSCGVSGASVWYQYTPTTDEHIAFDTYGSNFDTVLSVWTGTTHPLTEVACNDDGINKEDFNQSQLAMPLTAGTTYYISATGNFAQTGEVIFNAAPVINDLVITTQPTDQNILVGQTATLNIDNTGERPYVYEWYQGQAGDTSRPVGTNLPQLTTQPLTETAHYWVRITNPTGSLDSDTATITVDNTNGVGMDDQGNVISTTSHFEGMVTRLGQDEPVERVNQKDKLSITFNIAASPDHVGQSATIIMVAIYLDIATGISSRFMRKDQVWKAWEDAKITNLTVAETVSLTENVKVTAYEESLEGLPGHFTVYVGYRLANNELFYSGKPLTFEVE